MRAAVVAAEPLPGGAGADEVAAALARGATLGARGNSGIILSQVLRGVAEATVRGPLTGDSLRVALRRAAALVRESLSVPVEGTILTVLECAADCAAACEQDALAEVAVAAADGAAKALGDTPTQLGVLRAAGVVDAGARGLVVLLDALVAVTLGETPARPEYVRGQCGGVSESAGSRGTTGATGDNRAGGTPGVRTARAEGAGGAADVRNTAADDLGSVLSPGDEYRAGAHTVPAHQDGVPLDVAAPEKGMAACADAFDHAHAAAPHFEVMYVLDATDTAKVERLRTRLDELGDSVVIVGDGAGSWSAHVHCADAGAAVEAGMAAGTVSRIRIESFAVTAPVLEPVRRVVVAPERGPADRAVLAVATGAGAAALFEAAGAVVLNKHPVTSAGLLTAIRRLPHREVLVLPNGALPAHELVAVGVAARDEHRDVLLLPSGCMVQGLAALAVHDRGRIAVDDAFAMSEAAAAMRWGSVRAATQRALTMVGTCEPGDGLGLVGHDVVVIDRDVPGAGRTLLHRMLGLGGELVTLLIGAGAPAGLAEELSAYIEGGFPGVEVTVYSGGQHGDLVQIGVE
ncbi:DAK2 domain-containing protein [Nocardia puris]|nr:DAK2 domain-containing protein [Nocardia puris]MBF6369008.1 DAK2 domain-containing protein [Nocardia puris]MBF6462844.1 DAK2 domain-containing protein [Nocardia puris]